MKKWQYKRINNQNQKLETKTTSFSFTFNSTYTTRNYWRIFLKSWKHSKHIRSAVVDTPIYCNLKTSNQWIIYHPGYLLPSQTYTYVLRSTVIVLRRFLAAWITKPSGTHALAYFLCLKEIAKTLVKFRLPGCEFLYQQYSTMVFLTFLPHFNLWKILLVN